MSTIESIVIERDRPLRTPSELSLALSEVRNALKASVRLIDFDGEASAQQAASIVELALPALERIQNDIEHLQVRP